MDLRLSGWVSACSFFGQFLCTICRKAIRKERTGSRGGFLRCLVLLAYGYAIAVMAEGELPSAPAPSTFAAPQSAGGGHSTESLREAQAAQGRGDLLTIFRHSNRAPWYVAGQFNTIFQAHPGFHSPYQGPNSFRNGGEYKTSLLGTLYLGFEVQRLLNRPETDRNQRYNTDFILDLESSGGRGLSQALGLAGFTNLDVVRNPNLGSKPYVGRVELHQTIGLSREMIKTTRGPLSLATRVPVRRLELRLGKMSLPDVFDIKWYFE